MEIRKATLEDALILSTLNVDVQRLHAEAMPQLFKQPGDATFAVQFMREQLLDPLNHLYIGFVKDEATGYILARLIERPENLIMYAWTYLSIEQISVKPSYRHMGCGTKLVDAVKDLASEMRIATITLTTWAFNEGGLSFFRKQGFETYNERLWLMDF